jgi:hypothetical protein
VTRETIYAACFAKITAGALVAAGGPFRIVERGLKHWNDVPAVEQPALFQTQRVETAIRLGRGAALTWTFHLELYLYAYNGDQSGVASAIAMNPLVDWVESKLAPGPAEEAQTLGGLVSSCGIVGTIETDEGALGPQSMAIIPVEIVIAST